MGGKAFDLTQAISGLLNRIEEGRKAFNETQNVRDRLWSTCANRDKALQLRQELEGTMASQDDLGKSQAQAELDRLDSEYRGLADEAHRQSLAYNGTVAFIEPFHKDVKLLLDRLPLRPEWKEFREDVGRIDVRDHRCWADLPANSALDTLEMRLREMLDLAGGTQPVQVPRSYPSRRVRGPKLDISRERIELEESLSTELTTVALELRRPTSLGELRKKFPVFQIWQRLSGPEQEELLTASFKPKAYAQQLVMRQYSLTSEETLKKDKKKLRAAENKRPIGS